MGKKMSLQHKILFGYVVLVAVIGSMAATLLHERKRLREIEAETVKIRSVRLDINKAHSRITGLAIRGESVVAWEEADYRDYRRHRLLTDSLLQTLKPHCREYVHPGQIDTLRHLLAEKETHLLRIMQNLDHRDERDSLLATQLPEVAKRATRVRTIRQKKKGIAGLFGKKEEIRVMPSAGELHALSDSLTAMQRKQEKEMDAYADSLRIRNRELNRTLNSLVSDLDRQAYLSFSKREQKTEDTRNESFSLLAVTLSVAAVLLFLSYLTIHREIKRNADEKRKREKLIEKLQETIRQNEELTREKQSIMQTITHELRSPLSAIRGYADMIASDEESSIRVRHAKTIGDASGRMAGMIDTLLNYFRLDSGKETVCSLPFRVKSIAEILETEFMPQMEKKRLAFETVNEADEVVMGDRNLILRIGSNLLSNALKFTQKGSVRLITGYSDGNFMLAVDDTGTGIDKGKQNRIFKPFERLGNAATQDGFGLGLAIVRSLAELMDGSITVESVPGKGSRFTVTLPLEKATETERQPSSYTVTHHLSGCSVLSMDNDQMVLGMLHDMFEQSGVHNETCMDMGGLTEKLRGSRYDLLTTDLKMPDISGYEVLELLRSSDIGNSRTIPVLAITGSGSVTEEELKQAGFSAVLFKPFSIDELLAVAEQCIGENRTRYIDLTPLFAYGNKRHRLECLISETEKEMAGIRKAIDNADKDKIDGWIHHIRSSWMLIRAEQPLQELYEAIHENRTMEEIQARAGNVLLQGEKIIRLAKKEIEKTKWEK
ncbi:hybrid sensor histidine kinase/response regulator [Bacteroides uniformis]|jgi:two-component system sensor histidine kinase EvgS|uniref:hybrid sensor histidine kinase/response regulator n=1 Tax=Bacteroides uniformis TaxID=820 RepID=UPI000E51A437|nr:hybrid sensor histidine kinase/response regulator [Bacteroides uniformis]RHG76568.1 hybrid sensor histidine kinase/response regulator [Bacteroides uniformis]